MPERHSVPRAVTANVIASSVASQAQIEIIDFLPIDDGLEDVCAPYAEAGLARIYRRRQVAEALNAIGTTIEARVSSDDTAARALVLILYGFHRARDFDTEAAGFDADVDVGEMLSRIVRDGPEVGVHTVVWSESATATTRRMSGAARREFSWRVVGAMSEDDSQSLIGTAGAVGLRDQQIIVANDDLGVMRRCTSLSCPPAEWAASLIATVVRSELTER